MEHRYCNPPPEMDQYKLECVTVCMGFDDILDYTLGLNHPHVDMMVVVTSHDDKKTQAVVKKHGATLVVTDLHKKNVRNFNKGAAINAGFGYFQFHGWRLHIDCDIILADNFRRMIFNHTHLNPMILYGADRVDLVGLEEWQAFRDARVMLPQHMHYSGVSTAHGGAVHQKIPSASSARFVCKLHGYCPIGFFQMWHASHHKPYPYSLGTAAHDDVLFAQQWPEANRRLLPSVVCYHLVSSPPYYGQNWDGNRRSPRLKK
jgi:hypothetical protein